MIARRWAIDSAALIAMRRCDPLSSPLVYQEFSARSLLMTHRSWPRAGSWRRETRLSGRDVAEAFGLVEPLVHQQIDVVEQELSALRRRDLTRRPAGSRRRPPAGRSTDSAARRARRARPPRLRRASDRRCGRLDAVAAAKHRDRHARGDPRDQVPVGDSLNTTARPSGRAPQPPPRQHLPSAARDRGR